jgi:hypothetical protein
MNHNIARKAHHKGTADWFFQGGIFKKWRSSPSLLWIHGKRMLSVPLCRHPIHLNLYLRSGVWEECTLVGSLSIVIQMVG